MATKVQENDEATGSPGGGPRRAAARPFRCRRQEDDQDREEARLCHHRRTESGSPLRHHRAGADRGHHVDAQRDGHQRHRDRRGRGAGRRRRREEEESEGGEIVERPATAVAKPAAKEPTDRTDDPVRMYLREMGSVELLSREGEIAIAKRIEAGRETMIAGLCEIAAHLPGDHHLEGRARPRARSCCATSSTSRPPMPAPTPRTRPSRCTVRPAPTAVRRPSRSPASPPPTAQPQAAPPSAAARRWPPASTTRSDEVARERARLAAGGGGRRRFRERDFARRHGGRAQAGGGRDLRAGRRPLQEAPPPAGPGRREQAQERDALALARSAATRSSPTSW